MFVTFINLQCLLVNLEHYPDTRAYFELISAQVLTSKPPQDPSSFLYTAGALSNVVAVRTLPCRSRSRLFGKILFSNMNVPFFQMFISLISSSISGFLAKTEKWFSACGTKTAICSICAKKLPFPSINFFTVSKLWLSWKTTANLPSPNWNGFQKEVNLAKLHNVKIWNQFKEPFWITTDFHLIQ